MQRAVSPEVEIPIRVSPRKIVIALIGWVLFLIVAGAIAAYFRLQKFPFNGSKWFFKLFDLDSELNIPAWYDTLALWAAAALLAVIATVKKTLTDRFSRYWRILALIFLYLGCDELLSIHELFIIPAVRNGLHLSPLFFQTWVIPGAILVGIFAVKYWKFLLHLPRTTRVLFVVAAVVYVGGALGVEMLSGLVQVESGRISVASQACMVLEESLEKIGMVIFIYALLTYLRDQVDRFSLDIAFAKR